ncbi:MAG: DNA-packaging protein [Muribaculaceae bacterium]|nr:DNA-packaging protein [Muribaculaceae bacterium]
MAKKKENTGGRPPIYKTPAELQKKIDEYFKNCPDKRIVPTKMGVFEVPAPTVTGLAFFLGFSSRQSFYDYENNEEFSYTIKRARLRIEREYEKLLCTATPAGAIFALKNFGWKDASQREITGKDGEPLAVKKVFITAKETKEVKKHIQEAINSEHNG